jgi:hypothetical protein
MDKSRSPKRSVRNMLPVCEPCLQASSLGSDQLRDAAATFYGTAGRAYLLRLAALDARTTLMACISL